MTEKERDYPCYLQNQYGADFILTNIPLPENCCTDGNCRLPSASSLINPGMTLQVFVQQLQTLPDILVEERRLVCGIPTTVIACLRCDGFMNALPDTQVHPAIIKYQTDHPDRRYDIRRNLSDRQKLLMAAGSETPFSELPLELQELYRELRAAGKINQYWG